MGGMDFGPRGWLQVASNHGILMDGWEGGMRWWWPFLFCFLSAMLSSSLDHIRSSIPTTAATFPGGSSELTRGNVPVAMCITLGKRTNALEENVMDQHSAKVLTMRRQRQSVKINGNFRIQKKEVRSYSFWAIFCSDILDMGLAYGSWLQSMGSWNDHWSKGHRFFQCLHYSTFCCKVQGIQFSTVETLAATGWIIWPLHLDVSSRGRNGFFKKKDHTSPSWNVCAYTYIYIHINYIYIYIYLNVYWIIEWGLGWSVLTPSLPGDDSRNQNQCSATPKRCRGTFQDLGGAETEATVENNTAGAEWGNIWSKQQNHKIEWVMIYDHLIQTTKTKTIDLWWSEETTCQSPIFLLGFPTFFLLIFPIFFLPCFP